MTAGRRDAARREQQRWQSRIARTAANRANRVLRRAGLAVRADARADGAEAPHLAAVRHVEPDGERARLALVAAGWSFWHDDHNDERVGYWGPTWRAIRAPGFGRKAARRLARGAP